MCEAAQQVLDHRVAPLAQVEVAARKVPQPGGSPAGVAPGLRLGGADFLVVLAEEDVEGAGQGDGLRPSVGLDRLVVGAQEAEDKTVSVRSRYAGDEGVKPLQAFIDQICKEIRTKEIRQEVPQDEKK